MKLDYWFVTNELLKEKSKKKQQQKKYWSFLNMSK